MATIIASTYELLDCIGSGGGGVVYVARHLRLNKLVVLKKDKRKITTRPEILRREVDALKDLSHSYIPQVYDFFVEEDTVYTVIDYVEGESLDKPLKRGERFTQPQIIKWACQILEALVYLHKPIHGNPPRGIVHSDIKPANIMLTPLGDIKLIDFNIALALGEENIVGRSAGYASPEHYGLDFSDDSYGSNIKTTQSSFFRGKHSHTSGSAITEKSGNDNRDAQGVSIQGNLQDAETMSMQGNLQDAETMSMQDNATQTRTMGPSTEAMSAQRSTSSSLSSMKRIVIPDARSDIYSLGATLYHLLSGVRPAKDALEVVPLSGKDYSRPLVDIITKAMNINPNLRYQSAEEMLYDFTHLREHDPRTIRRKRALAIVCSTSALLLAGSTFVSFVGLKRMEASQKALTYAEYSANALDNGDVDGALKYALEALPEERSIFTPGYTPSAIKALTDALGVYNPADEYKLHATVQLPSEAFRIVMSPKGNTLAAFYSFAMDIINTSTGEVIAELPIARSALSQGVYLNEEVILYAGEDGLTAYNITSGSILWQGDMATSIALSADGSKVAAVYRDEAFATVYDINGNKLTTVDFGGNQQRILEDDTHADPMGNIFSLSGDGRYLAVSFENGGLMLYDTLNPEDSIEIYPSSDYTHFEGGFCGRYFAFSGANSTDFEFATIDTVELVQTLGFMLESPIGVKANEEAIYIYNQNTAVTIDPVTGEQEEVAYTDADIRDISCDGTNTILITDKNEYSFYDAAALLITTYNGGQTEYSFVDIKGDYAAVAGRNTPDIRLLKKKVYGDKDICTYDRDYSHDEARVVNNGEGFLLFNYRGFRIYDSQGTLINEVTLPDSSKVYDQQFSHESGNLSVIYNDALRIYSGTTGELIFEDINLKSVYYTPYGISILDEDNNLQLISRDTGEILSSEKASGDKAVYCGMVVEDSFMAGRDFIGATKTQEGYLFALSDDTVCTLYDETGEERFSVPALEQCEAFFTEDALIISPFHGTPQVYDLKTGAKRAELEKDSYLTYITELDSCIISEYVDTYGQRYGIMLDKATYEPIGSIPYLTDIADNELIFDYHSGILRKTSIYSVDELISMAKNR